MTVQAEQSRGGVGVVDAPRPPLAEPGSPEEEWLKWDRGALTEEQALLFFGHTALAEYIAGRFSNRGEPLGDLRQVAAVGLFKAATRFEPARGVKFSTYATHKVVGELKRHFRDEGWSVKVSRPLQQLNMEINRAVPALSQELGRAPTVVELAKELGRSEVDIVEAVQAGQNYRAASIDAPSPGDDDSSSLAAHIEDAAGDMANGAVTRIDLRDALETLSPRDREIVTLRFWGEMTQAEIAERVGVSQIHVSRLLTRSFRQLSQQLKTVSENQPE